MSRDSASERHSADNRIAPTLVVPWTTESSTDGSEEASSSHELQIPDLSMDRLLNYFDGETHLSAVDSLSFDGPVSIATDFLGISSSFGSDEYRYLRLNDPLTSADIRQSNFSSKPVIRQRLHDTPRLILLQWMRQGLPFHL